MRCYHCMTKLHREGKFCPECGKPPHLLNPPHHLAAGTVLFGKYLIGNAIGEGGFGITYVGYDQTLDLKVAVKEFFPSGYANRNNTVSNEVVLNYNKQGEYFRNGKEDFLNEAKSIAKFSNESGVVDVREFFTENNTAYIVMEYLDGVNLSKYIAKHGVFPPEQIVRLMLPVMRSLEKIHGEGIIHRDISPDNIVYLTDGGMKLTDFGSARYFTSEKTKSLSVVLKPGYAPHEQYGKKGRQGPWTDVYALCATLYKCITGATPTDAFSRSQSDDLQRPSELGIKISSELEAVIMHGLAIHPEDRFQDMGELIGALNEALAKNGDPSTMVYPPDKKESADPSRTVAAGMSGQDELPPPAAAESITYGDSKDYFQKLPRKQKEEKPLPPLPSSEYSAEGEPPVGQEEKPKRVNRDALRIGIKASAATLALILLVAIIAQIVIGCQRTGEKSSSSAGNAPDFAEDILNASKEAGTFVCSGNEFIALDDDNTASYYTLALYSFSGARVTKDNSKLINNKDLTAVCGNPRIGYYGLKNDGTVVTIKKTVETQGNRFVYVEKFGSEISGWSDIKALASGNDFLAALTDDGQVVTAGEAPDVSDWTNITAISADGSNIAGIVEGGSARFSSGGDEVSHVKAFGCDSTAFCIKQDGSVLKVRTDADFPDTAAWGNIISVSAAPDGHIIGLKRDRTVVAVGDNEKGRCDVSEWSSIAAVRTTAEYTIGKKTDGSFVIARDSDELRQSFDEVVNGNAPDPTEGGSTEATAVTYTVVFLNYDGTVYDKQTVEEGKPAKKPKDPTRPSDRYYNYRFKDWSTDFSEVTSDLTIAPIFEPVLKSVLF